MKPARKCECRLGHKPGACVQTLFGLNLEKRPDGVSLIHGDIKSGKDVK